MLGIFTFHLLFTWNSSFSIYCSAGLLVISSFSFYIQKSLYFVLVLERHFIIVARGILSWRFFLLVLTCFLDWMFLGKILLSFLSLFLACKTSLKKKKKSLVSCNISSLSLVFNDKQFDNELSSFTFLHIYFSWGYLRFLNCEVFFSSSILQFFLLFFSFVGIFCSCVLIPPFFLSSLVACKLGYLKLFYSSLFFFFFNHFFGDLC